MNFKNMSIKKSLIIGFGTTVVVSVLIIIFSLLMMTSMNSEYQKIINQEIKANQLITSARLSCNVVARDVRDMALIPDDPKNSTYQAEIDTNIQNARNFIKEMKDCWPLSESEYDSYSAAFETWAADIPTVYNAVNNNNVDKAIEMIYNTTTPNLAKLTEIGSGLDNQLSVKQDEEVGIEERNVMITTIILVVVMVVATIIVLIIAGKIIKSITEPSAQVEKALVGFSQGDLSVPVEFTGKNELGTMCDALRTSQTVLSECISDACRLLEEMGAGNFDVRTKDEKMYVGTLSRILASLRVINRAMSNDLTQISQSADQVSAGSDQVSNSAQSLAQGATEQASAVQELSATITDISENAKKTAQAAEQAGQSVHEAGNQITTSVEYVKQLNIAMDNISSSSQEIGKIIATIENIAFQTNILALNAAVEAARAGSAGKGFAVVADEVRNLATKSDEAAKATKDLIDGSMAAVREGTEAVGKVTTSLEQTAELAGGVTTMMESVVDAVENQTQAIMQVTEGIDQISAVVQTNSATSEESAAASEELSSQATLMKELLSRFKLRQDFSYGSKQPAYSPSPAASSWEDDDNGGYSSASSSPFGSIKY